jgi:hypothetical protein
VIEHFKDPKCICHEDAEILFIHRPLFHEGMRVIKFSKSEKHAELGQILYVSKSD